MTNPIDKAQPEALRLADLMDAMDYEDTRAAAAELRRNWNALTMAVASAVSSNAELATQAAQIEACRAEAARWRHVRDEPYSEEVARVMRYQLNASMDQVVDEARAAASIGAKGHADGA